MSSAPTGFIKGNYHPFLFLLMTLCAIAEMGLTAFLIDQGNASHQWYSPRYHSLLILFLFNAVWTTLFSAAYLLSIMKGTAHILASIASSLIYLIITTTLWGTAAGVMHTTRFGDSCPGRKALTRCRQSLTVEAIGWTEFALGVLILVVTCVWVTRTKKDYRSSFYGGYA